MVGGMPFLTLETGEPRSWWERRRVYRGMELLRRQGVCRAAVEGPVPPELLRRFGLEPVDAAPLRRALLGALLDWADGTWQLKLASSAVLLSADGTDGAVRRAALLLAGRARYVVLDTGAMQTVLEEELRRRCGLGGGSRGRPVLEVCLGQAGRGAGPMLHLGRRCAERQTVRLWTPALGETEEVLLSALFQAGKLEIGEIQIKSVEFRA